MKGIHVLMIDVRANYETAVVLESLVDRGANVSLVTPHLHYGVNLGFTHFNDLLPKIHGPNVALHCLTTLAGIRDGKARLRHAVSGKETEVACDLVVSGKAPIANDGLLESCKLFAATKLVGDAVAPRSALEAIREGDRAGRTV